MTILKGYEFRAQTLMEVVAWCQIVLSVFTLAMMIYAIVAATNGVNDMGTAVKVSEAFDSIKYKSLMRFLLFVVGVLFGIVLLRGTNEDRKSFLEAWFIYALVIMILTGIFIALSYHPVSIWISLLQFFSSFIGSIIVLKYVLEMNRSR